jgi:hypothetical protein
VPEDFDWFAFGAMCLAWLLMVGFMLMSVFIWTHW